MTDVLLLAMSRLPSGVMIAGMTTEPDPVTKLRWVRPISSGALALDDLRYADGVVARPGDVLALELGDAVPQPPHVENIALVGGLAPVSRVRQLSAAKRSSFFASYLDPAPRAVLLERSRSLCLVQPEDFEAVWTVDDETGEYEARLALKLPGFRRQEQGTLVTDIYWRALGRQLLGDEPFAEFTADEIRSQMGELYVVLSLNRKGTPTIAGVHTVPEYPIELDPDNL